MNKLIQILTFSLMLLIIGAPSCMDEEEVARQEQAALEEVREDIRNEFETEYLTEASLYAYETTAKQKITDLFDYIQIMTDTSLDMSFRIKASEMIRNTFLSENVTVAVTEENKDFSHEHKVSHLVRKGLNNKLPDLYYSVDSIQIFEPLHRIDNKTYSGILWFLQNFTESIDAEQGVTSIKRFTHFYVRKEDKVFGKDSLKIWNIHLGQIR